MGPRSERFFARWAYRGEPGWVGHCKSLLGQRLSVTDKNNCRRLTQSLPKDNVVGALLESIEMSHTAARTGESISEARP